MDVDTEPSGTAGNSANSGNELEEESSAPSLEPKSTLSTVDEAMKEEQRNNIIAYTLPSRDDCHAALKSSARLKWLRIEGLETEDLADPGLQTHMNRALCIHIHLDNENKEKPRIMFLKFTNIEQGREAMMFVEEKLSDRCKAVFALFQGLIRDYPVVRDKIQEEAEIHVENQTFLCVSDLPPGTTDADLAAAFPSCPAVNVCRRGLSANTQRYGYVMFSSKEELEKFVEKQKEWHVDIQGRLCPLTYTKPMHKTLTRSLHISERRLILERIRLLHEQDPTNTSWHFLQLCKWIEQDLELRKTGKKTLDKESETKEETETEKRVQVLMEKFQAVLETLKKSEAYQKDAVKRKQPSGGSEKIVTEGAEKLLMSQAKNKKRKKAYAERMHHRNTTQPPLFPYPPQDQTYDRRPAVLPEVANDIGQAISGFANTLGMLSSIVADHLGPQSSAMDHPSSSQSYNAHHNRMHSSRMNAGNNRQMMNNSSHMDRHRMNTSYTARSRTNNASNRRLNQRRGKGWGRGVPSLMEVDYQEDQNYGY